MKIDELKKVVIDLHVKGSDELKNIDIANLLDIDENDFTGERQMLPQLYVVFTMLLAVAKGRVLDTKMQLETTKAQMTNAMEADGKKLPKEKWKIESRILASDEYKKVNSIYLAAQKDYAILTGLVDALEIKKDMLMSLAADKRKELGSY